METALAASAWCAQLPKGSCSSENRIINRSQISCYIIFAYIVLSCYVLWVKLNSDKYRLRLRLNFGLALLLVKVQAMGIALSVGGGYLFTRAKTAQKKAEDAEKKTA